MRLIAALKGANYTNFLLVGALSIVFYSSCKENTILPPDLVPPIDNINTFGDTIEVISNNFLQDSLLTGGIRNGVRVSNSPSFFHALGTIANDQYMGRTWASIHVEVLPPTPGYTFKSGTNRVIDSIVLSIPYKNAYGDTVSVSSTQNFKLYRSLKAFSRDSSQYDFTTDVPDYGNLLAQKSVNFSTMKYDSVLIGGKKQEPQLRFQLASWFKDSLEAQVALGSSGSLADYTKFLAWWNGFYIEGDTLNGNALGYFDTYRTRMSIYYRYDNTSGQPDTTVDVFSFDPTNCNRFNHITRNYTGKPAAAYINSTAVGGDSILFLQNEPGLSGFIRLPGLHNRENVIVNKAELSFVAVSWTDTLLAGLIPRLQMFKSDTAGNDSVLEDYNVFGTGIVDGRRYALTVGGVTYTQYKFIITHSVQKIISQKDSTFRLKVMGLNIGYPAAFRSIVGGSANVNPFFRPKLYLVYTKIDK
ncbi:MAG: DUF4270 family protein [Chitinophagaceae bacterium]|nr:DUF4270 family protein [Chitinophagaceae bacterium]